MAFSILYWANYTAGTRKLSRKSEIAVQSDHVLKFVYDKEASYMYVRGTVQASMRDRSYNVTITLGPNYNIEDSTCECVNGQDKCHHKASILLYGYKNVSKTDVRQSWIKKSKVSTTSPNQNNGGTVPCTRSICKLQQCIGYWSQSHLCLGFRYLLLKTSFQARNSSPQKTPLIG